MVISPAEFVRRLRHLHRKRGLRGILVRIREQLLDPPLLLLIRGLALLLRSLRLYRSSTLYVFYDLDRLPSSFDICWVLAWAEHKRKLRNLDALHFVFVPMRDSFVHSKPKGHPDYVDADGMAWRQQNILVPVAMLHPSSKGISLPPSRIVAMLMMAIVEHRLEATGPFSPTTSCLPEIFRDVLQHRTSEHANVCAPVEGLRLIEKWIQRHAAGRRLVTITLRTQAGGAGRNSDIPNWLAFAHSLDQSQYMPVFVPDTDQAFNLPPELARFTVFDPACWNIGIRVALYERAYLNLFVNNGPASLSVMNGSCRYIIFKILVPGEHLASESVLRELGFTPGHSPPFAGKFQKWVWEPDTTDVISREFSTMCHLIEQTTGQVRRDSPIPSPAHIHNAPHDI